MEDYQRLKELRKGLQLTQKEIAKAIDRPQPYYSRIENGHAAITYYLLAELLRLYRVNPAYIIDGVLPKYLSKSSADTNGRVEEPSESYRTHSREDLAVQVLETEAMLKKLKERFEKMSA